MVSHKKIHSGIDVSRAIEELEKSRHLFGEIGARKGSPGSPHSEMDDIWVRYQDISEMQKTGDYSKIVDEHDSVWLKDLSEIKRICFHVMTLVNGERLGGILVTSLPPGGNITTHTDSGWHAEYYDKFYVPIVNSEGSDFNFEDGVIRANAGDVWMFDNSVPHSVSNNSNTDRIALIICIKQDKYKLGGDGCHLQQR